DGNGRVAVSGSKDHTLRVWNLPNEVAARTLNAGQSSVTAVAVSENGTTAVSAAGYGPLTVWDVTEGYALQTLRGYGSLVTSVAMSGDGVTILSASADGALRVWDVNGANRWQDHPWDHRPFQIGNTAVALGKDGALAIFGSHNGFVNAWHTAKDLATTSFSSH